MSTGKKYTISDLKTHGEKGNLWVLLHGKVHDVSKFYLDHPWVQQLSAACSIIFPHRKPKRLIFESGGEDALLECAGVDATSTFEDVGHSAAAREVLRSLEVGSFSGSVRSPLTGHQEKLTCYPQMIDPSQDRKASRKPITYRAESISTFMPVIAVIAMLMFVILLKLRWVHVVSLLAHAI